MHCRKPLLAIALAVSLPAFSQVDFGPPPPIAVPQVAGDKDMQTLAAIAQAITSDETLNGADISLTISEGNVTIGGTAVSESQAAYAKGVAIGIAGADNVEGVVGTQ